MASKTDIALDLLLALIARSSRVSSMIADRRASGEDLTDADLDELAEENDAARDDFRAAIDRAKAEGR